MNKIKYNFLFISLFGIVMLNAQDDKPAAFWNKGIVKDFKRIQAETEAYYKDRYKGKGSGYNQWKRWEYNNQDRLAPNGEITNYSARNNDAMQEFLRSNPQNNRMSLNTWTQWGQNNINSGNAGTGVLNCVAFDNDDANIIYTGGPACGLWKTTNGGTSWTNITDNSLFSIRGISSIVVDHQNDNNIYILTGDADGSDSPSIGVWKSTNGGINWFPTGLNWAASDLNYAYKMAMAPTNSNLIIVATKNNGIYRTTDGGGTWTNYETGTFYDVVWKPGSSSIVYAGKENEVYKSSDGGVTWTLVAAIPFSERVQLAISPSNADYVYALGSGDIDFGFGNHGFPGLWRSIDSGSNWSMQSNTPSILSVNGCNSSIYNVQAKYNVDLAVKPTSTSTIITGGINVWRSSDSGVNWNQKTLWCSNTNLNYLHSDVHGIEYNPLNNKLYVVCDGGIYVSPNDGNTFQEITNNMQLNAFFDFAGTKQNSNFMIGGLYHNGTRKFTGTNNAPSVGGGDGTGCMIDHSDVNTFYYSSQLGNILKTTDGGASNVSIKPSTGNGPFVTKMSMNPSFSSSIYVGWKKDTIFISQDKGASYTPYELPYNLFYNNAPGDVKYIDVSPWPASVYACTGEAVFHSTDFGATWSNIYSTGSNFTSVVAISQNKAIITRGGYDEDDKVYLYDVNDGITNISNNLPNVPIWISAYSPNNITGEIYIGTDLGVFKSEFPYTTWSLFGTNILNLPVKDLAIYPNHSIIRAATYGRGLFQADITCNLSYTLTEANDPNYGTPAYQYNQASSSIFVERKVQGSNGNVWYKAGDLVLLTNGFLATEGNTVIAKTAGCGVE